MFLLHRTLYKFTEVFRAMNLHRYIKENIQNCWLSGYIWGDTIMFEISLNKKMKINSPSYTI